MHAERDHLRDKVFPELEERLRQRRHYLEPIDLRVGVETGSLTEQQAREIQILKVCLNEIDRSRPFLIALIGDRYGWVPPADHTAAAANEAGLDGSDSGKSVTALEIEYGILKKDAEQRSRSLFYLREPLPYDQMGGAAGEYNDALSDDPVVRTGVARLAALKHQIQTDPLLKGRVHTYRLAWDPVAEKVSGLEEWGQRVLSELWAELEEETRDFERNVPTNWQAQERESLLEFVDKKLRDFSGRQAVVDQLFRLAVSPAAPGAGWCACVTGEPGSGKSTVFARLFRELSAPGASFAPDSAPLVLAHAPSITPRAAQVDAMLRRWVEELAAEMNEPPPLGDGAPTEEVARAFSTLLQRMSSRRRVVVLVDALDQFEPTSGAQNLTWLPNPWPANARLMATAIQGVPARALSELAGAEHLEMPALDMQEAAAIGRAVWHRYHRECNPDVLSAVLALRRADGRQAHGNPLWLYLAMEQLNLLDADDFGRAGPDLQRVMSEMASQLPPEVEGMYAAMLERIERTYGHAWARALGGLVTISRGGWRDSDLQLLVPRAAALLSPDAPPLTWDPLVFATLRRGFRAQLMQSGSHGRWGFSHAQMGIAVERRYLADTALAQRLHAIAADHLLALSDEDPLRTSETMHHLIGANDHARAVQFYVNVREGGEATRTLANHILATLDLENRPGLTWAIELLNQQELVAETPSLLCGRFAIELHEALADVAPLEVRLELSAAARETFKRLEKEDPEGAGWQRGLLVCHHNVGEILTAQGDLAGALRSYRESLRISERLAASNPDSAERMRDLSVSQDRIGTVLAAQGNLEEALNAYRTSLEICERLMRSDSANSVYGLDLAVSQDRIGNAFLEHGDLAAALYAYRTGLQICEALTASDPANAIWQGHLSEFHISIGDVLRAQGNLNGALQAYRSGLGIRERLVASNPANATYQRDLSGSHDRIGNILSEQGDLAGALQAYRAGLQIREHLTALDPSNSIWQRDLALSYYKLGRASAYQDGLTSQLRSYRSGLVISERLLAMDPSNATWQRDVATAHDEIADILKDQGNLAESLQECQTGLEMFKRLAGSDPANAIWQRELSVSHHKVGDALRAQGDLAGALKEYRTSLEISQRLVALDPGNASWLRDLSVGQTVVGEVLASQGDLDGALHACRAGLQVRERLVESDPGNPTWQRDLSLSQEKVGDALSAQGDLTGALQLYQASRQIHKQLLASDSANEAWQHDLSVSQGKIGEVLAAQGDLMGALEAYRMGFQIRDRLAAADPGNAHWQRSLWISSAKVAEVLERQCDPSNVEWWRRACDVLLGMKKRGMFISQADEEVLSALEENLRNASTSNATAPERRTGVSRAGAPGRVGSPDHGLTPEECNNLGVQYDRGDGVRQDVHEAIKWYRLAAENGALLACVNLGALYNHGQGVPVDYVEAAKWFRLGAELGSCIAQNDLGLMYADGKGVPQDYTEAANWFRKAAEQGHPVARKNLMKALQSRALQKRTAQ